MASSLITLRFNLGIGSLRGHFFDARIKGADRKSTRFVFEGFDLFETYNARKSLREVGFVDGSVVVASVRAVGGARFGGHGVINTFDDAKKDLKFKVKKCFQVEKPEGQVASPET